ncbi:TPA: selenocysteine-specific translation elongation factor [Photobacterium damselae]
MVASNSSVPYQAVIGLAGHVDHGKTALIQALTGMMTARAHEQALGMTQDLGFAHFQDESGNTIGVVDVPGHERYLRNMVAGVWHLNVLLLVIAADEGWMPMTTSHVQVAHAMGIEHIVVCINKKDKVDASQLADIEDQALDNVMELTGLLPEIVAVSALTHDNISMLRQLLISTVHESLAAQSTISSQLQLYVDRAFVVNGIGTVITGTLAHGTINLGDKVRCYPSGIVGTVRSIQAYHQSLQTISGTCRVALNIKGVSRKDIGRGHLVVSANDTMTLADQCIIRINKNDAKLKEKKQRQVEAAIGTWHGVAKVSYLPQTQLARVVFNHPIPLFFGQRLALIQKGGSRLMHGGEVVWHDFIAGHQKRALYQALDALPVDLNIEHQRQLRLTLQGYFEPIVDSSEGEYITTCDQTYLAPYCFASHWLDAWMQNVLTLLQDGDAMATNELSSRFKLDDAVVNTIMQHLKQQQKVHLSYGKWRFGAGDNEDDLPVEALAILQQIRQFGKAGLELNKVTVAGGKKWLRQLSHQKYITALDDTIYFDMGLYHNLVKDILADHQVYDRISMGEIKDRTELSRKYSIPLANRMEKDGWVRRDGDERVILKIWQS